MAQSNYQVNLLFNANTQQAKAQLQSLQTELNKLTTQSGQAKFGASLSTGMNQALQSATKLQAVLNTSVNAETGVFDITKFVQNMNQAGLKLSDLQAQMKMLGPAGQQAFSQLSRQVLTAQAPIKKSSALLEKMGTTLKNTIRWQISASLIQGFVRAIQSAYNYAQDLNESLNNIRIVTGYSAEEMDRFADKANKAAKSLSASTLAYTDAALIYYQQGLSGKAVEERTNTTIKLANVTSQSAETVSEWMTAIWNNFDDGTKSLEYYADVITALGAATASSSEEIATGLEKFAAVAETTGLSYEYATAALATVTAETRQSADVVGTAFKTLFARIQDLELGETLDDGVTLGKYSQALEAVGVQVLDFNGEVRDMDLILSDLGGTWDSLTKAQQISLAQTVAGMRQYNQFLALMSNWDTMQKNLETAGSSSGELEKQQDTWAESWEGAQKRVQNSAEELYTMLLNDDFFIELSNMFADLIDIIKFFIDALGGVKTLLPMLIVGFTQAFGNKMLTSIRQFAQNVGWIGSTGLDSAINSTKQFFALGAGGKDVYAQIGEAQNRILTLSQNATSQEKDKLNLLDQQLLLMKQQLEAKEKLAAESRQAAERAEGRVVDLAGTGATPGVQTVNTMARQTYDSLMVEGSDFSNLMGAAHIMQSDNMDEKTYYAAREQFAAANKSIGLQVQGVDLENTPSDWQGEAEQFKKFFSEDLMTYIRKLISAAVQAEQGGEGKGQQVIDDHLKAGKISAEKGQLQDQYNAAIQGATDKDIAAQWEAQGGGRKGFISDGQGGTKLNPKAKASFNKDQFAESKGVNVKRLKELTQEEKKYQKVSDKTTELTQEQQTALQGASEAVSDAAKKTGAYTVNQTEATNSSKNLKKGLGEVNKALNAQSQIKVGEKMLMATQAVGSYSMSLNALSNGIKSLTTNLINGDATAEDWLSTFTTFGMYIPMLITSIKSITGAFSLLTSSTEKDALTTIFNTAAKEKLTAAELKEKLVSEGKIPGILASIIARKAEKKGIDENTASIWANNAAMYASPWVWILAIIMAVIAAIVILTSVISANTQAQIDNNKEKIEEIKENLELINSNQELANSISDLTDKYQDLQKAGESTLDTFKQLKEDIPKLIESYKELEKESHINLNVEDLEKAYDFFLATGDINPFQGLQNAADEVVQKKEYSDAERMKKINDTNISLEDLSIYDEEEEKYIDLKSGEDVIQAYENIYKKIQELEAAGQEDSGTYRNYQKDLKKLQEFYDASLESRAPYIKSLKEQFSTGELGKEFENETKQFLGLSETEKITTEQYLKNRDEILQNLMESRGLRLEEAEAILASSDEFKGLEQGFNLFDENSTSGQLIRQMEAKGGLALEELQKWYDNLPEHQKTLTAGIDWTLVTDEETLAAQMDEQRKKFEINEARGRVESADIDTATFEAYREILADENKELEKNEVLSAKVAASNLVFAKGLQKLNESWEENYKILKANNRLTPEYAEAIGEVQTALTEAFGVKPSVKFIQNNLNKINSLAQGNVEVLDELQQNLAEDYVANIELEPRVNDNWSGTKADIQNALYDMLEDIDTSIAVGKGTTLSGDYLDSLQAMLDSGALTEEKLQEVLRAKGYEYEITDWKEVDGPKTTITRNYLDSEGNIKSTETYEDIQKIQVPIINGVDATGAKTVPALKVSRSIDKNSVNFSQTNKGNDNKDKFKKFDEEAERYHEITAVIEDYESELDRINTLKDQAFGAKKLQYMDAEIAKNQELIKAYQDEIAEIEKYLALDKEKILQYGVAFDEYGRISNYDEVYQNMINQYNANVGSEEADQAWEDFQNNIQQYEESLDLLQDKQNQLLDKQVEQISLNLERINEKVTQFVELAEDELTVLEHQLERLEDTAFDSAEAIALIGKQAETSMKQWEAYQTGIKETLGVTFSEDEINTILSGGDLTTLLEGKELTADQIEQLREYRDGLLEAESTLREQAATVREEVITSFEEWNEEMARGTEQISHQQEMLENYRNIIDIVGKDTLGISDDMLKRMSQVSVNSANNLLAANKSILDANKQAVADAYAEMNSMADPEQRAAFYRDVIVDMEEQLADSESNYMDSWTAALEAASTAFDEQMARITESYSKALGGVAGSLEQLTDQFEKQSELADYYLKDYEKTYEISKLNRQITQSIDESDNVASKQALAALQDELLAYQKEGKQMSDYDLQYLQKKYDLTLAQIALEEAQNAKSQVRLQRDSLGNYGYVYTADQGAVDSAQQSYEDKLYDIQQFMDESMQDLQGRYLELNQQYLDELNSLDKTAEDYKEHAAAITAHYQELLGYVAEDMGDLVSRGAELNQEYGTTAKETFNETILGNMYNDLESFQQLHDQTAEAMKTTLDGVNEAYDLWQENVSDTLELAGTSTEEFAEKVNQEAIKINQTTDGIAKNTEDMKNRMSTAFGEVVTAAGTFVTQYGGKLSAIKDANDQLSSSINSLIAAYSALTGDDIQGKVNQKIGEAQDAINKGNLGAGGGTDQDTGRVTDDTTVEKTEKNETTNIKKGGTRLEEFIIMTGMVGTEEAVFTHRGKAYRKSKIVAPVIGTDILLKSGVTETEAKFPYNSEFSVTAGYNNLFNNNGGVTQDEARKILDRQNGQSGKFLTYDTGGYTGSWGPEGRLAMLHQKEIVLNAHDTKNLLDTVSIVRSIVDQIELNALASSQGIGVLRAAAVNNTHDVIEQNVKIEAHFPNAVDHTQIEEAFGNLVNLAAQHANRKE